MCLFIGVDKLTDLIPTVSVRLRQSVIIRTVSVRLLRRHHIADRLHRQLIDLIRMVSVRLRRRTARNWLPPSHLSL